MNHQQMLKPALVVVALLAALALAGVPVGNVAYLLVALACPLMMILMMGGMAHGGHGGHRGHGAHEEAEHDEAERP